MPVSFNACRSYVSDKNNYHNNDICYIAVNMTETSLQGRLKDLN